MASKILTTHVGSLPRSKELSEYLFVKDKGEEYNKKLFGNILSSNVEQIVKRQLEVGGESERRAPADLDDFPDYKEKLAISGGTPTYSRPCCTNELKIKDNFSLLNDIENFSNECSITGCY